MNNHEIKYKASLDLSAKIITLAVMGLIAGTLVPECLHFSVDSKDFILDVILVPLCFVCYLYSVRFYLLTDDAIIIKRPVKWLDKKILLSDINKVGFAGDGGLLSSVRKFGNGGFFGYMGKYWNSELGNFTMYATNRNNRVIIKIKNGKIIVVTPDDATMAGEINKRLASA